MHDAALTSEGRAIFAQLHHFGSYYLAGGTALALQLGHRRSVDFDLFGGRKIPRTFLTDVERVFSSTTVTPSVNHSDELTVLVNGVKLTFLHYPFPVIRPLVALDAVRALGIAELAAMKAYTIGRRSSLKDFVDMHAILIGRHLTLAEIIALAEEKYDDAFNGRLFLEQLLDLHDIEDEPIAFLGPIVSRGDLSMFFERTVRAYRPEN